MSTDAPILSKKIVIRAILIGITCFLLSLISKLLIFFYSNTDSTKVPNYQPDSDISTTTISAAIRPDIFDIFKDFLVIVVVSPVFETLLMAGLHRSMGSAVSEGYRTYAFIASIGILAWLLHGAGLAGLNRVMPFMLLGFCLDKDQTASGYLYAITNITVSHLVWNLLIFAGYAIVLFK